jgi:ATP adenylyltransferase
MLNSSEPKFEANPLRMDVRPNCRFCCSTEETLHRDDHVFVVPSVGSLVEGWLLAVPQRHVVALVDLYPEERAQFAAVTTRFENVLRSRYGDIVLFEHGPAAEGRLAGCGVDHAHMHLVPTGVDLLKGAAVVAPDLRFTRAQNLWDAEDAHNSGRDYVFLRDQAGDSWLAAAEASPSQLFRRVLARAMNLAEWDWKSDPRLDIAERTRSVLRQAG